MQEDHPLLPRIFEGAPQFLVIGHHPEAALRVWMGERVGIRGRAGRPLRRAAGGQLQQRLGGLRRQMTGQRQQRILAGDLPDVGQPLGGNAVVQQPVVRDAGEDRPRLLLGGHVPRHRHVAHHFADFDELRRSRAGVPLDAAALRPAIRGVVLADVAEQEIGGGLVHDHAQAAAHPHRPEVPVAGALHPVKPHPRPRGIKLQVERRGLGRALLLARQARQALGKGIGNAELHSVSGYTLVSARSRFRPRLQWSVLMVICRPRNCTLARFSSHRLMPLPRSRTGRQTAFHGANRAAKSAPR